MYLLNLWLLSQDGMALLRTHRAFVEEASVWVDGFVFRRKIS